MARKMRYLSERKNGDYRYVRDYLTKLLRAIPSHPKLELFNGWGIYAQNFEGQILKNVMLEGVKEGIVCLPMHNAVAVPLDNIGWACDEMRYQWDKQTSVSGLARVTTDIPA